MLTTMTPANLANMTENATSVLGKQGDQYDARGAMYFTVATVCVYGLGIIFFIGSHISRRENKDEEHQIEHYLKTAHQFQYQKERDEVLRLRARWLADSLVGMPGSSNYERRLSRAQRPIRLARVLSEDSSGGESQTPLVSPDVSSPDCSSVFPWPHMGRRMRRNACSISFPPIPDVETEREPESPDMTSASTPPLCESHQSGLNDEEGTEGSCDDTDRGVYLLDTAASSEGEGGGYQEEGDQRKPCTRPDVERRGGDFTDESPFVQTDRRRQDTSDVYDSDERNEYDDSSNDSDECPRVKTRGSHSVSGACGSFLQQHERQTIPAILITSSSSPELNPSCSNRNLYPFFDRDGMSENDTGMPCERSNAGDDRGDLHDGKNLDNNGGPGGASEDRRRRHGVYQVPHPIYPQTQHSNLSQLPFDPNQNASGDYNGNFQAADESSCEPNPGSNKDYSRLLPTCDARRASRWSLPGRVTSRAQNDVRKVRNLGRRVLTLLRIPGLLRGQSLSNPLLASPTSPSPPAVPGAQLPFEETMV